MRNIFFIIVILISFSSCSILKRNVSSGKASGTVSEVNTKDSGHVAKNDSTSIAKNDSTGVKTQKLTDSTSIGLEFEDEGSNVDSPAAQNKKPIVITKEGNKITVDPGGRKLKNLNYKTSNSDEKKDSSHVVSSNETAVHTIDSLWSAAKDSLKAAYELRYKDTQLQNTSYWPPWYAFVIVIVAAVIIYRFNLWKRKNTAAANVVYHSEYQPPEKKDTIDHMPPTLML